jgi:hypothetical protein
MGPTKELVDAIYLDRVCRARDMPPEQKLLAGPRLFEMACNITRAGIRAQFPDADSNRVEEILRERLALQRRLERRQ